MVETLTMARENTFNMRLSDEEAARLKFLTDHYGIGASALFRMLLKKEEQSVRAARVREAVDEDRIFDRCVKIEVRRAKEIGGEFMQPSRAASGFDEDGTFVLRNTQGELARYRYNAATDKLRSVETK